MVDTHWQTAYRLLRVSKDGKPQTLFHGWNGSRTLPLDAEMRAREALVSNPGGDNHYQFISGWHVLMDRVEAVQYRRRFKDTSNLVVCEVQVAGLRPKPRSPAGVQLAILQKITTKAWEEAVETWAWGIA